jgi:translocation and assembly module TamB
MRSLTVNGEMSSPRLVLKTQSARANLDNLLAHYSLADGDATLRDLRAAILGGELTVHGTMKDIGANSHSDLSATVHGISLADLRRAFGSSAPALNVSLAGKLDVDATAAWGKTLDDLVAHTNAAIKGQLTTNGIKREPKPLSNGQQQPPSTVPIVSSIHATYTAGNHQLAVDNSYLRTLQTDLTMNGVVSKRSRLALRLQANDLSEAETIADLFRSPSSGQTLAPLGLAGTASFQGSVEGSTEMPRLTGNLTAVGLHFKGTEWKVLRTGIDLSPAMARLQHADLEAASHGHIILNASTGLNNWSFTEDSPILIELDAAQMNLADLTKLTGQQIPVTGTLNANVSLHGTELSPAGSGRISLTNASAYEQPVDSVQAKFAGANDEVHGDLSVHLRAGSLQGTVSVRPRQRTYNGQFSASGIRLDQLQALKEKGVDASGVVDLKADGQGTFENPQMSATLNIPSLALKDQTITGLNLQMNVSDHAANATLTSTALKTSIQARAKVALAGDYLADASLDTQGIALQPLVAIYAPEQADQITGQTEVHATMHGPLKDVSHLEAHVTIPVLNLAYGSTIQLAAVSPIHIDYQNSTITVQRTSIRGTDTDLGFEGSIPTNGSQAMSLLLHGTVNLELAQLFAPGIRSSGRLVFNIDSRGALKGGAIGGQVNVVDANIASNEFPVGLQHGNGVLTLTQNRVNISSFEGLVGGGKVTAQGGIAYWPAVQFDMGAAARGIRILYPQGMRESVDADLRLTGSTSDAVLGGSVNLSDLSFTQAFDLSSFVDQFSGSVAAPPSRGLSQNIGLNIAVHSTNNVNLVSRTLSVGGSANLQVRGTAANPVVLGRVSLNNGDIILNGNRFVLNGGTVQFVNPSETQPVVNLSLTTTIQQYNINLRFNGPVEQLHAEYSSDPALPSADIINLLAFGQTTDANAANAATPANQAAESLVASQVSSQVTSRVSRIAGISQLSINPILAGSSSQGPPGANITIQQRVTGNLFVTFSTNVASTQSQTIQGQYQVSPRVAVSATRDPNGGFAVDTLIKKSW